MVAGSVLTATVASSSAVTSSAPGIGVPLASAGVPVAVPMLVVSSVRTAVMVSVWEAPGARRAMVPMAPSMSSVTATSLRWVEPVLVTS